MKSFMTTTTTTFIIFVMTMMMMNCSYAFVVPSSSTNSNNKLRQQLRMSSSTNIDEEQQSSQKKKSSLSKLESSVLELKKVIAREYITFFDPMKKEYYNKDVTFHDPLNKLEGIDSYEANVDMLAGRTLLGKFLFENASIDLHSIKGGKILDGKNIDTITTRWTLRFTMKALPWKPTARFSGISEYKVVPKDNDVGLEVIAQQDYWDSINLQPGGNRYEAAERIVGLSDLWDQIKPGGFQAAAAAPELPYTLLRRGRDYQVRKYPAFTSLVLENYQRRDEGYEILGSFTRIDCEEPLGPAILKVNNSIGDDNGKKSMEWPLTFALPNSKDGNIAPPTPTKANTKLEEYASRLKVKETTSSDSLIIAVREFTDASMEPVVRKNDRLLRESLKRDGLKPSSVDLQFAQYDAIFSMGTRRGEVWIPLADDGHPW